MDIRTEVRGLVEAQRKLEQVAKDTHGEPMVNAMRQATMLVTRDAKILSPVDTGLLRSSITPEVRPMGNTIEGIVGSNKTYAPYVELGTRPHFPPPAALAVWARRHGVSAYVVARAIARRGTRARRFLQDAFEQNQQRIIDLIGDVVSKIVRK